MNARRLAYFNHYRATSRRGALLISLWDEQPNYSAIGHAERTDPSQPFYLCNAPIVQCCALYNYAGSPFIK